MLEIHKKDIFTSLKEVGLGLKLAYMVDNPLGKA